MVMTRDDKSIVTKDIRPLAKIDVGQFRKDIKQHMPDAQQLSSLSEAVDAYDSTLTQLLDKYAPLKSVKFNPKKNLWWNEKCQEARNMKRRVERTYKKHKDPDKQ